MRKLVPNTDRIIIHLDYDCFYASCVENQHPELKGKPLAVQQKQIIVTCNYPARARGLRKLQLITEAKHICPELVIVLAQENKHAHQVYNSGEDISLFRDVSKDLLQFVRAFSWNLKVERLGLDEIFLDVTDLVDHNTELLNVYDLKSSFFHLSRTDPTAGFQFDATLAAGQIYNEQSIHSKHDAHLWQRLVLGSHLCLHIRQQIEAVKGYTCTGGIATNKLLSKLIGNVHKPMNQTTLMPPYAVEDPEDSAVMNFMNRHEVGKIPGVGFKMAVKLREYAHQRNVEVKDLIMTVSDSDLITVGEFKALPGIGEAVIERILGGVGSPKGIGLFVWKALHGVDDQEVAAARDVPKQISIEDSYLRLDTLESAIQQMIKLTSSLITRMRLDLTGPAIENEEEKEVADIQDTMPLIWLAQPKTIRLSTRPRAPIGRDGVRPRIFNRISRSRQVPSFMMSMTEPIPELAERVVAESLLPMFRQLHPQRSGWDLSLVNVAVTDMQEMAGERRMAAGRDISKMFRNQDAVLSAFRVHDDEDDSSVNLVMHDVGGPSVVEAETEYDKPTTLLSGAGSEDLVPLSQRSRATDMDEWDMDDGDADGGDYRCHICGGRMPAFALAAHERYHDAND